TIREPGEPAQATGTSSISRIREAVGRLAGELDRAWLALRPPRFRGCLKTRIARGCPPRAAARAAGLGYDAERLRRTEVVESGNLPTLTTLKGLRFIAPAWRASAYPGRPVRVLRHPLMPGFEDSVTNSQGKAA